MAKKAKALVLAAGYGSRLRPWTDIVPKPLIPVMGVEPLFWALSWLNENQITDVIVNTHHLHEQIEESLSLFATLLPNLRISISSENDKILGSGGGVLKVIQEQKELSEGLLVLNADTLSRIPFEKLVGERSSFAVTFNHDYLKKHNPLFVNQNNEWCGLKQNNENTLLPAHFLGTHFLAPKDIHFFKSRKYDNECIDLFSSVYSPLVTEERAPVAIDFRMNEKSFWYDLNQKSFFDEAEQAVKLKHVDILHSISRQRHPTKPYDEAITYWPGTLLKP